jgi:hypothetical protein
MAQYFSPFAAWYAWACLREPTPRRWWFLVGLVTWQILASLHLGWFLGVGLLIFVGWGLAVEPGSWARVKSFVRGRPVAMVVPLLAAGLILGLYARNFYHGTPGSRAYWEAAMYCPYIDGWFVATPGSLWADHLTYRDEGAFPEKCLFQGFSVYGVFIVAGWYAWRRQFPGRGLVLAGVGTAVVLMLLVTRFGWNASLWYFVHAVVPGANAFRAVGRIAFAAYMFGLIGGLIGVQALLNDWIERRGDVPARTVSDGGKFVSRRSRSGLVGARVLSFGLIAGMLILEQLRPFPESFDKRAEFLDRVDALTPALRDVDTAWILYDGSMPGYRHEIAAMWAGLRARTPVMNGFSGTVPPGFPGLQARPTIEDCVRDLGQDWRGRVAMIEWGPPVRRMVYQVEPGGQIRLVTSP